MSVHYTLPPVHECDKLVGLYEPSHKGRCENSYSLTVSYRNSLGYSIIVIDRNNLIAKVPYNGYKSAGAVLIVEYRLSFKDRVNLNWDSVLNATQNNAFITALNNLMDNKKVNPNIVGDEIIFEYTISHAEFYKTGSCAYYQDLDVVIAKADKGYNTVHPFSITGQNLLIANNENVNGFYYRVIINDPFDEFGDRYININAGVFKVNKTVDSTIKPGVYLYTKDSYDTSRLSKSYTDDLYYPFSEADEKVNMYTSAHLAATLGDANHQREEDIRNQELDIKRRTQELGNLKLELETKLKTMEHENKVRSLKMEQENLKLKDELEREKIAREAIIAKEKHEYDMRSRTDKEYYEKRSYERKDANEYLKMLPTIIACIAGVANIILAAHKVGLLSK